MKHVVSIAALLAALSFTQAALGQVRLRSQATVNGDVITLGDLFAGADALANREVAPAPAPGQSAVYKAGHLVAIARSHGLDWRPASSVSRAVVRRSGETVSEAEIVELLRRELRQKGALGRIELRLNRLRHVVLQPRQGGELRIEELTHESDGGPFSAYIHSDGPNGQAQSQLLRGRVDFVARVPVPTHGIRKGQTITSADIKWTEISLHKIGVRAIEHLDQVVGLAAKRNLRQNQPLKPSDLRTPIMIAKGAMVTVALNIDGLSLSSTGRALDDGSHGEIIQIMNLQSKRTLEATVVAPNRVRAALRRQLAVAATE